MSDNLELARVSDGLGLTLKVDVTRPLAELTAAVNAVCDEVEKYTERTVVVLRLDGARAESRMWPGAVGIRDVNRWERAVRRLERLPAANVVVASGPCGGPALDLLLAADFRIGAPDLVLVLPVNDGHFWPGMSVYRLVQNLGVARARQIVIWGMDISVAKASELGLVDQVNEDLDTAVHTAIVLMGRVSDQELAVRRQLLLEAPAAEYDDALGVHLAACDRELRRLAVGAGS
ncbi:enoyl-CoA-hydratase DpgB [Micromonospora sp. RTGN7]|uniref:enoyl-CoA-hydratase DpgB n=1 Tax=Micromonospora sp. RTGN7 TaxID=3016526 RepID=UPI0029FEF07F|nr:enoyl-CoA-hydratase DpgB [Micromonospora sp. RTGN7]